MAGKIEPGSKPSQPGKKAQAEYSPDAEMADTLYRAGLKEFPTVTPEERRGLSTAEIRQLHIARLLQRGTNSQLPAPPTPAVLPQRRRGPANTHDWHTINGKIMRHLLDADGRLAIPENESLIVKAVLDEYAQFERYISDTEVREAVRRVCAELRKGPKPLATPRKKPSSW